jgi:hypothetical protein
MPASMPPFPGEEKWPCPNRQKSNTLRLVAVDLRRRSSVLPALLSCVRQRRDSARFFFLSSQCALDTPWMSIYSEPFLYSSSQVQRTQRRIARPELHSEVQNVRREFVTFPGSSLLRQATRQAIPLKVGLRLIVGRARHDSASNSRPESG